MEDGAFQVGPLTPQELDHLCQILQRDGVPFEILKDEETEKLETKSDFHNLVTKSEFRTESYLGQIFYLSLHRQYVGKYRRHWEKLGLAAGNLNDESEESEVLPEADWQTVQRRKVEQSKKKYVLSSLLLVVFLYYIFRHF
jgi:hypothetical protein